jgi:hypothetical protein
MRQINVKIGIYLDFFYRIRLIILTIFLENYNINNHTNKKSKLYKIIKQI